jgi:hypothetical protein
MRVNSLYISWLRCDHQNATISIYFHLMLVLCHLILNSLVYLSEDKVDANTRDKIIVESNNRFNDYYVYIR